MSDQKSRQPASSASKVIKKFNCILPPNCSLSLLATVSECCGVENCPNGQNLRRWDESSTTLGRDLHPDQILAKLAPRLIICHLVRQDSLPPIFEILANDMSPPRVGNGKNLCRSDETAETWQASMYNFQILGGRMVFWSLTPGLCRLLEFSSSLDY